ncbi:hypothetical protein CR513_07289, partial [Mucuna pruriens]
PSKGRLSLLRSISIQEKLSRPDQLLPGPNQNFIHSNCIPSSRSHSIGGARCFSIASLSGKEVQARNWEAGGYQRSSADSLHVSDPEIEITLRRLRKVALTLTLINFGSSNFQKPNLMENNDWTLKELAMPNVCTNLEPVQSYELKSSLIYLLPKFHGLAGEGPHKNLKEFHVLCSTMRLHGILKVYIKMKAFPFSLDEVAKD